MRALRPTLRANALLNVTHCLHRDVTIHQVKIDPYVCQGAYRAGSHAEVLDPGSGRDGWEVRDEQDDRVLKQVCYTDWHRVERALNMFNLQIGELEGRGWSAPETRG